LSLGGFVVATKRRDLGKIFAVVLHGKRQEENMRRRYDEPMVSREIFGIRC
jgi:hypothetical protein